MGGSESRRKRWRKLHPLPKTSIKISLLERWKRHRESEITALKKAKDEPEESNNQSLFKAP